MILKSLLINKTMETYRIIRFYRGSKRREIIRTGFTLKQAKEWCSRDDTKKENYWFDGYEKEV